MLFRPKIFFGQFYLNSIFCYKIFWPIILLWSKIFFRAKVFFSTASLEDQKISLTQKLLVLRLNFDNNYSMLIISVTSALVGAVLQWTRRVSNPGTSREENCAKKCPSCQQIMQGPVLWSRGSQKHPVYCKGNINWLLLLFHYAEC